MNLDTYDLDYKPDFLSFEFFSEGPKGRIKKFIQFEKIIAPEIQNEIYNLSFGDYNDAKGRIDDLVVSDNKDAEKVLNTVVTAIILFTDEYPNVSVLTQGSTPSRTRYYTMEISKHLQEITGTFEIWGALSEREWELFREKQAL